MTSRSMFTYTSALLTSLCCVLAGAFIRGEGWTDWTCENEISTQ